MQCLNWFLPRIFFFNALILILILFDAVLAMVQANARKTFEETLEGHVRMARDLVRTDLVCVSLFSCLYYFQGQRHILHGRKGGGRVVRFSV